jgi:uncharacterized membrane protein
MKDFFSREEELQIIRAIRQAEKQTSGEIRVHLDGHRQMDDVLEKAERTFIRLGMDKTAARNGVMIFIAPHARSFAILGDQGIDEVVASDFWSEERDILQAHFKNGQFADGVIKVVEQVGAKLKDFFPYQSDDENELPDEISYED